jgi:superoxide dismutase
VKASFFDALWHIINWEDVSSRFESARRLSIA